MVVFIYNTQIRIELFCAAGSASKSSSHGGSQWSSEGSPWSRGESVGQLLRIRITLMRSALKWRICNLPAITLPPSIPTSISWYNTQGDHDNLSPFLWLLCSLLSSSCKGEGLKQCCGSGSGIGCLFDPWIPDLGSRIPNSYFWEFSDNLLGKKFHNSLKFGPNFFLEQFKN